MKDYYSTLGVPRNANQDDVKRAFRKLASQHHPDKGGDTQRFQEIQYVGMQVQHTGKLFLIFKQ